MPVVRSRPHPTGLGMIRGEVRAHSAPSVPDYIGHTTAEQPPKSIPAVVSMAGRYV
jgi:hypothetical protein